MGTQPAAARTLVLLRHALADPSGASDHGRSLTRMGRDGAAAVGAWLAGLDVVPDAALVSDATRTEETWLIAAGTAGWTCEPTVTGALYTAGADTLLDLLREVPADARTVVVVGHNPTISYVVGLLDDGNGDPDACTRLMAGSYPPASATVFCVERPWSALGEGGGTVLDVRLGDG